MSRRLKRREVIAIRRLYDAYLVYGEIAEAMNVPRQTVSNVVNLPERTSGSRISRSRRFRARRRCCLK